MKSLAVFKRISEKKIHIVGTLRKTLRVRLTNGPANANINFFPGWFFFWVFCVVEFAEKEGLIVVCCFQCGAVLNCSSYLHFRYFSSFWFFSPVTTTSSTYWQSSCVSRCWMTSVFSLVCSASCADGACVQVVVIRQASVSNTAGTTGRLLEKAFCAFQICLRFLHRCYRRLKLFIS